MIAKRANFLYCFLCFLFAVSAASLLYVFTPTFETSRAFLDHFAKDGSLELFSRELYTSLRVPALAASSLLLITLAFALVRRDLALKWLEQVVQVPGRLFRRLSGEAREFFQDIRAIQLGRTELILIAALVLVAFALRIFLITQALEHDEAYTVVTFASGPLRDGLSDYHHPNNHLLHTLLVHFAIQLFGLASWAVRLPAFLAGIVLIPLVYLFARRMYSRQVAFLAAGLTAGMPEMIYFSTNARGYTMIMGLTLVVLMLAAYVRRHKSLFAWALLIIFSALGFYTIPIFLLSYAIMLVWFFLLIWVKQDNEPYSSWWDLLKWLAGSGVAVLLLTLLLYSPVILRYHGVTILFPDPSGANSWKELMELISSRAHDNWVDWLRDLPQAVGYLAFAGAFLAILLPEREKKPGDKIRAGLRRWLSAPHLLIIAAISTTVAVTIILRPNLYSRFMSYAIPLMIVWAAAGWLALLKFILRWLRWPAVFSWGVAGFLLVLAIVWAGMRVAARPQVGFNKPGPTEQLALYLKDHLQGYDLVVVSPPYDAILWYYSRLHQIDMNHYKRELPFFRAYVVVDPGYQETVKSVLIERGPELNFFHMETTKLVYESGPIKLYEIIPDAALIRREYKIK